MKRQEFTHTKSAILHVLEKYVSFGVGLTFLVSPMLSFAQTTSTSNTSIFATFEQLVETLTHELNALVAAHARTLIPLNTVAANSNASNNQPQSSATIDDTVFASSSPNPMISGTFISRNGSPEIVISELPLQTPITATSSTVGVVWNDTSSHNGGVNFDGNRYSDYVSTTLSDGVYNLGIYREVSRWAPSNFGNIRYTATLLTSGTFTVKGSTADPIAAINQKSLLNASNLPVISGTATNTSTVSIVLSANGKTYYQSGVQPVTNGVWQVLIQNQSNGIGVPPVQLPAGNYTIRVYGRTNNLLATDTLVVRPH
jgi:hypothetical protein